MLRPQNSAITKQQSRGILYRNIVIVVLTGALFCTLFYMNRKVTHLTHELEKKQAISILNCPAPTIIDSKNCEIHESTLDDLKARYEELLVTHLYLQYCGLTNNKNLDIIHVVILKDLKRLHAAESLRDAIFSAAHGTFFELYPEPDCAPAATASMESSYKTYIDSVSLYVGQHPLR